jgi:hypothetical protein
MLKSRSASVHTSTGSNPAPRASARKSSTLYLCEFSVWINAHVLRRHAVKVHFDPARVGIVMRAVAKLPNVEIGAKLLVDAAKQVEIETCGHALRIVVGGIQDRRILLQVDADHHRPARPQHLHRVGKKTPRIVGLEIPQRGSGKEPDPARIGPVHGWPNLERLREIGADRVNIQVGIVLREQSGRAEKMLARNIDRHISSRLFQRVEQRPHLFHRAASILDQMCMRADMTREVVRDRFEQRDLRARRVILRLLADRIEQCRPAFIVKELAGERLWLLAQPSFYFGQKIVRLGSQIVEGLQQVVRAHRSSNRDAASRRGWRAI